MPLVGGGVAGDHFERLNERVLEKIGVKIGPYWHLGFLVFFCDFNNSQRLQS